MDTSSTRMERTTSTRMEGTTGAQKLALLFGIAFLGAGVLGFIPGITTNYDEMKFIGHDSDAKLLGLFQVSIFHNIVHLLFGIGVLAARRHETASQYLLYSGIAYAALIVYGVLFGHDDGSANFVPVNSIDTWALHLPLAAGLLLSYFVTRRAATADAT